MTTTHLLTIDYRIRHLRLEYYGIQIDSVSPKKRHVATRFYSGDVMKDYEDAMRYLYEIRHENDRVVVSRSFEKFMKRAGYTYTDDGHLYRQGKVSA